MERFRQEPDPSGTGARRVACPYRGSVLLRHPMYNKGSAFTSDERVAFGLEGLLPAYVSTMEQQSRRSTAHVQRKESPLEKYIGLASLQDRNEHLFYRVLADNLEELLPIVYTPTVGLACQRYSHIFRRARGVWITPQHRGRVADVLRHAPFDDVRLVVVTDNERILGLGDQGAGGMGIPIGKLALYTAAAGIPPWQTLPVSLDIGTDNMALLEDDLYLGWRAPRLRGAEYDSLVDEFVRAVVQVFPRALLQWEDFKKNNAFRLLDRYRDVLPSFNDDIQGTAAVAVATLMAGARARAVPLASERVVMVGAGAAGVGIARLLRSTLARAGLGGQSLASAIAVLDRGGLIVDDNLPTDAHKQAFAWPRALAEQYGLDAGRPRDLLAVIRAVKPTVLIGTSGEAGCFTELAIREMARYVDRPVVLPLSNPNANCEARPADVVAWTDGRALVATGSPFDPVEFGGRRVMVSQANNVFVFPGIGLGALVVEARGVTDGMFAAAADAIAAEIHDDDLARGGLLPPIGQLRQLTARVALAVAREAREAGVAIRPLDDAALPAAIANAMWEPRYPALIPAATGEEASAQPPARAQR